MCLRVIYTYLLAIVTLGIGISMLFFRNIWYIFLFTE